MTRLQTQTEPAKLVVACIYRQDKWLLHAIEYLVRRFGEIERRVGPVEFSMSDAAPEAEPMKKVMLTFRKLVPRDSLASLKVRCHEVEMKLRRLEQMSNPQVQRPINLDPAHLFVDKFIVASSKDESHRIYLGHGVFADLALILKHGHFESLPWTFSDYLEPQVISFLAASRRRYMEQLHSINAPSE